MKGFHALLMGFCAVIVIAALISGASIGPLIVLLVVCFLMMAAMMRMAR